MLKTIFKCSKNVAYSYVIYQSIFDVDAELWNSLNSHNNIYVTKRYLSAIEKGLQNDVSFRYLVFYDEQKNAVGISVFQIMEFLPGNLLQDRIPCGIVDKVQSFFLENKELKLLICGNLFSCGENGYSHTNSISTTKFFEILTGAIADIKKRNTTFTKISFSLFKEFWPGSTEAISFLEKSAFNKINIDVNMVLQIQDSWLSFEDYLMAMNTKYRTRTKSVYKKSAKVRVQSLSVADISHHIHDIARLYNEVLENADYNLAVLNTSTFIEWKKNLKEEFSFIGYYFEDKLIGFSSAFIYNDLVDANFIGIDYKFNNKFKLYQRILYDYVHLGINHKKSELRLGRTAETSKSALGALPVVMKLYAKHRHTIPTKIIQPLMENIIPDSFELRKPFK